jgi:ornithine cyclodeaminase/alanine dehydrogenase-like protein (mu-crystallin family)
MRVRVLSHDDVLAALPPAECAEAMAAVLTARANGHTHMPLRSVMMPPHGSGFMGLMPAWRGNDDGRPAVFALKSVCVIPGNPARGLDAHQGTVTLFDGDTGVPTAILDASAITEVRTAAVTAVATRQLAREDAPVLAILGAGVQGRAHLRALRQVRPFESIRIYAPTRAHAEALARDQDGVVVAPTAEEAVLGAEVVVTATSSREPVLDRSWLVPGAHVNAVGASIPSAREIDVATVAASAVFADSRESLANEAGEFRLAIEQNAIAGEQHVRAELGDVLAGTAPGRRDDQELTLFRSLGLAVEDLAAAELALRNAIVRDLGTQVRL